MGKKRNVRVTQKSETGRNTRFVDEDTNRYMSTDEFNKAIEHGTYSNEFHTRMVNGVKTPVSNPDKSKNNNLG